MEDKLAKVIAEIKRLKEIAEYNLSHSKMDRGAWMQQASVCTNLISFIDSMQKEPIDDDIEKAVDEYLSTYFGSEQEKQNWPFLKKMAIHFAEWQKEQIMAKAADAMICLPYENKYGGYTQLIDVSRPLPVGKNKIAIIFKED